MPQTIVEYLREQAVSNLFATAGFAGVWPTWKQVIHRFAPTMNEYQLYNLGDHLKDVFYSTNTGAGRTQSEVSGGGAVWEALVCWYLNLCSIGRRTVVIKHNRRLIPAPVSYAITVNYGTFPSNTESDLIAITFPDNEEYSIDKEDIQITDVDGRPVPIHRRQGSPYNLLPILNALCTRDFNDIEIHIIQCKTNWNDNAQIPMLWDAVYSASTFRNGITIGTEGFSITDVKRFTYSFVTVPTVRVDRITPSSLSVLRVQNLSGGNYWGLENQTGIANSVKQLLDRNLRTGHSDSHLRTIRASLPVLQTTYTYFQL